MEKPGVGWIRKLGERALPRENTIQHMCKKKKNILPSSGPHPPTTTGHNAIHLKVHVSVFGSDRLCLHPSSATYGNLPVVCSHHGKELLRLLEQETDQALHMNAVHWVWALGQGEQQLLVPVGSGTPGCTGNTPGCTAALELGLHKPCQTLPEATACD